MLKETVYDDIKIEGVFAGQTISPQGCHILITTNGHLKHDVTAKNSNALSLKNVKLLIIDEADLVMKSDFSSVFLP